MLAPVLVFAAVGIARAVPVAVGATGVELVWGIDPSHPLSTERGGPSRTGRLAGTVMDTSPAVGWEVTPTSAHPRGPVVSRDGTTYLATSTGLLAIDRSGAIVFETTIAPIDAPPALTPDGSIVVLTRDRDVAIVGRDGTVRSRVGLPAAGRTAPLVLVDGSVVAALLDRTLVRLRADLELVFSTELPGGALTPPSLTMDGDLAIASGDLLYLVDVERGEVETTVDLGGRAIGAVAVRADGALVLLVADGEVVVVRDGVVEARFGLGGRLYAGGALALLADGGVVVAVPSRGLVCLAADGTERWVFSSEAPFYGVVSIDARGRSIAIDRQGRLHVVDAGGAALWRMELAALEAGGVAIDGERLVVATDRPSVLSLVPAP